MSVAASSPAWLTRRAESRKASCRFVRGRLGVALLVFSCCVGEDTEAIERMPLLRRACSWKARGVRCALRDSFCDVNAVLAGGRDISSCVEG